MINKGETFSQRDIYIDYDFEQVMFRWDHISKKQYRKFYGQDEEMEVPHDNRLYNDALISGDEITEAEYRKGKPCDTSWYNQVSAE